MQNLKAVKDQAFCIVHHVKDKFCVHYERQISKISIFCVMQNLEIGKYRSFNIMHHKNTALVYVIKLKYPIFFILHHEKSINWQISSFYILHQIKEFVLTINVKYQNFYILENLEILKYQAFYNGIE